MPELSPIQASPTTSPYTGSAAAKENISSFNRLAATVSSKSNVKKAGKERVDVDDNAIIGNTTGNGARRPFGALNARENLPQPPPPQQQQQQRPATTMIPSKKPSGHSFGVKAAKVLGDLDTNNNVNNNVKNINITSKKKQPEYGGDENSYSYTHERSKDSTNVKDRMREWEREKERLREMDRLEEMERDRDEIYKREKKARKEREEEKENRVVEEEAKERKNASHLQIRIPQPSNNGQDWDKENVGASGTSPVLPMFKVGPPLTQGLDFLCVVFIL
jgi:hypothetical protein